MLTPKKRSAVTLEVKKAIIEAAANNTNQTKLAEQFKIPRTTLKEILKNKTAILKAIEGGGSAKRARLKPGMHSDMEQALALWIKQVRSSNLPVSGELVKEKALKIASLLNIDGFEASEGWLTNFKLRHGILFKSTHGEAGAINVGSLQKWQDEVLRAELSKFKPDDIFNIDETGLFWQLLPNKTLAFKGEKCAGGKKSKERVTVLVGANMTGTEKLPLLVIGKSKNPRCFKSIKVPLDYMNNQKAWMTGAIFEEWLKKWDKTLEKTGRKVLLYVDNCSAHPHLELDNITLKFFPPNTTAMSQPCDQGIIQNLKVHYRRFLLRERIKAIDDKKDILINLLGAVHNLRRAWAEVKPETIANCFRHVKFVINSEVEEIVAAEVELPDDGVDELLDAWADLQLLGGINEDAEMWDFMAVDADVVTDGFLTLEEIVAEVQEDQEAEVNEPMDVEEVEAEKPVITRQEAQSALNLVRRYVEHNFDDPAILKCSDQLDEAFYQERRKKEKQSWLTDYFSSSVIE